MAEIASGIAAALVALSPRVQADQAPGQVVQTLPQCAVPRSALRVSDETDSACHLVTPGLPWCL